MQPLVLIIQTCKQLSAPWEGVGWRKMGGCHLRPGVQMASSEVSYCLQEEGLVEKKGRTFFEAVSSWGKYCRIWLFVVRLSADTTSVSRASHQE